MAKNKKMTAEEKAEFEFCRMLQSLHVAKPNTQKSHGKFKKAVDKKYKGKENQENGSKMHKCKNHTEGRAKYRVYSDFD